MNLFYRFAASLIILLAFQAFQLRAIAEPTDFSAASSFDVVATDEAVHLLFAQPENSESSQLGLYYTRSDDAGKTWSPPVTVSTRHAPPGPHQPGNTPQLAVSEGHLMALWTAKGTGPWQSGPLATALSTDGGRSWKAGPAPGGAANVGFRFPAATAGDEAFHVVWIHALDEERSLRHASLGFADEDWSDTTVIDPDICACCWNTLKMTPDGQLMVLYRDQDPSDMSFAVSSNNGKTWETLGHAGTFGWYFNGCPHVGGAFAFDETPGETPLLLGTVWTGHPESGGAYILRSTDEGRTWKTSPFPGPKPGGHVFTDVTFRSDGDAAIVWDLPQGDGWRAIFVSTSADRGNTWSSPTQISDNKTFATHPRIVAAKKQFLVFWHDLSDPTKPSLRMARFPVFGK